MVKLQTHQHQQFSYPEKSKKWLEKDGWTGMPFQCVSDSTTKEIHFFLCFVEGSGMGRDQQGIKECIKTSKLQQGNAGIGATDGEGGDPGWWNDLFMLSARKLKRKRKDVEDVERNTDNAADTSTSTVAKRTSSRVIDELCPLYSRFTRGKHTHLVEETEKSVIVDDDGSTSTVVTQTTTKKTTIVTTTANDGTADVMQSTFDACQGKAGRYIIPEAKLARIAAQDAQFLSGVTSKPNDDSTAKLAKMKQRIERRKAKANKKSKKQKKRSKK